MCGSVSEPSICPIGVAVHLVLPCTVLISVVVIRLNNWRKFALLLFFKIMLTASVLVSSLSRSLKNPTGIVFRLH